MIKREETEVHNLKERLRKLEIELENKKKEVFSLFDKIEFLENTIMKYEKVIGDSISNIDGDYSAKALESKLKIEIEDRDRKIRELKDKMGFLRKDKLALERELENLKKEKKPSSVIRVEEQAPPLESLVKDLQTKLNRAKSQIEDLKKKLSAYEKES